MAGLVKRHNGFILAEYLVAIALMGLLAVLAVPAMTWDSQRHEADLLTRELAMDLQRIRQLSLANGLAANESWAVSLRKDRYLVLQRYTVRKTRVYPAGISIPVGNASRKDFTFNYKGKPQADMTITISAEGSSYRRAIVVAAQTGRIRIE